MKITIAGAAALAALVQGVPANASPFSVGLTSSDAAGYVSFTLTGDTSGSVGEFKYDEVVQVPAFLSFLYTDLDDQNAQYSIYNQMQTVDGSGTTIRSADFRVFDPNYSYILSDRGGPYASPVGYDFTFHAELDVDSVSGAVTGGLGTSTALIIPPGRVLDDGVLSYSGNPFVSPVPLPASAPMFGAALFTLGAAGFCMKRKRIAVAA